MSGDLGVATLSELLLTLTRLVAATGEPSLLAHRDGLTDLELPVLELYSDTAL
jgi:hypothetical protein